jgi:hypothetical protein
MKRHATAVVLAATLTSLSALAGPSDFCNGYAEGYRSVRGDAAPVPACPQERPVPHGSSAFREGVKAGIQAGRVKP